eukprot:1257550-Prymnesium_polylepis.1
MAPAHRHSIALRHTTSRLDASRAPPPHTTRSRCTRRKTCLWKKKKNWEMEARLPQNSARLPGCWLARAYRVLLLLLLPMRDSGLELG